MKKSSIVLLLIIVLISCKKSVDSSIPEQNNSFRIKTTTTQIDNESSLFIQDYIYEEDKLTEILGRYKSNESGELHDNYSIRFTYNLPIVIAETFIKYSVDWVPLGRFEYEIINGRMTKRIKFEMNSGVWEKSRKATYTYIGEALKLFTNEIYSSSGLKLFHKREYKYKSNVLDLCYIYETDHGNLFLHRIENYSYEPSEIMMNSYRMSDSVIMFRIKKELNSGKVIHLESYGHTSPENELILSFSQDFKYNNNGLLQETSEIKGYNTTVINYEYELGNGNISWFYSPEKEMDLDFSSDKKQISF